MSKPSLNWSILVPTVSRRVSYHLPSVIKELERQAHGKPVEILYLGDNRRMSTGRKCQWLLDMAAGMYISYVADDDWIEPNYIDFLLPYTTGALKHICFDIQVWETLDPEMENKALDFASNKTGWIEIGKTDSGAMPTGLWLTSFARTSPFPDLTFQEDVIWAAPLREHLHQVHGQSIHLSTVLYHYKSGKYISEDRRDREMGKPDEFTWNDVWRVQ